MSRIAATFAALHASQRTALIPYIMTGFPQANSTVDLMHALADAGADIIELGIPFSDPMADGPIIQAASETAIANGIGLPQVLEAVRDFRQRNTHTPVVLMGYANSIEAYCLHHTTNASTPASADPTIFAQAAADAGVDGILVVDYPPEECTPLAEALHARGLDMIFLLAPTSSTQRMQHISRWVSGYVYYVSLKGVTGSGALDTSAVAQALPRIRQHISTPVGVGFGIRDAASACAIARHADAVVIGSKIIELIQHQSGADIGHHAAAFIADIRAALDGQSAASADHAASAVSQHDTANAHPQRRLADTAHSDSATAATLPEMHVVQGSHMQMQQDGAVPVKMWTQGVPVEDEARQQLLNVARLPIVFKHVAAMPDVHYGIGATIGSVIPTVKAIIPAAVGVDIGCGMMACKTTLTASDLPDDLGPLRAAIEKAVPHGANPTKRSSRDKGSWENPPAEVDTAWAKLADEFEDLCQAHPHLRKTNHYKHLGTLGGGNHFIEICLDEAQAVWVMLHSGSRGVGNAIGTHFIELAKKDAERNNVHLPDQNLAYLEEGAQYFGDYVKGVGWAQKFAAANREVMMQRVIAALRSIISKPFNTHVEAVNCHHNYVQREVHFGQEVFVTRKGAVSAEKGQLGIIPGSMGAKSYIVRGKGNPDSFNSCSHGAGRTMSRAQAKKRFTVADQVAATAGVECRKDANVIDEIPMAYKDIDAVMAAQRDLVDVVHTLKQVLCVKG